MHTDLRTACDFQNPLVHISIQERDTSHPKLNSKVRATEQGESMHRKYKSFKLGGGQAYNHSCGQLPSRDGYVS
jgi:hypothetical protein